IAALSDFAVSAGRAGRPWAPAWRWKKARTTRPAMIRTGAMREPLREADCRLPDGDENRIVARSKSKASRDRGLRLEVLPGHVAVPAHAVPPAHFRLVKGFVMV